MITVKYKLIMLVICLKTNVVAQHAIYKLTARGGTTSTKSITSKSLSTLTFTKIPQNKVLLFTMN